MADKVGSSHGPPRPKKKKTHTTPQEQTETHTKNQPNQKNGEKSLIMGGLVYPEGTYGGTGLVSTNRGGGLILYWVLKGGCAEEW